MSTTELTLRTWNDTFEKETGTHYTFKLRRLKAYFLEWEDLNFNHDSSVLIADHRDTAQKDDDDTKADHTQEHITALTVIAAAYRHIKDHPEQTVLLVGHTDRSGDAGYNLGLSRRRAENVLHLLRGDKGSWAKHNTPTTHHEVEDYQQLLAWLHEEHGWATDPGKIDNKLGKDTKAAVERFQIEYNQVFGQAIPETGVVTEETWGAFFDVYMRELQDILDVDASEFAKMQQSLKFLDRENEFVGCGENWPLTALNRSRTDRRVELYFFDPGEEPTLPLKCHPSTTKCLKDKCELHDKKRYKLEPLKVEPILPPRHRLRVHLTLLWKDPAGVERPFPKDMPVKVHFGDGSSEREVKVGDKGVLDFIVDNRKGSFTLGFEHAKQSYFVSASEGAAEGERLVLETEVPELVKQGARVFALPLSWNLDTCDWKVDTAKATTYSKPNFTALESISDRKIGAHGDPCRVELELHWQYLKFLYFDRILKKELSILPVMLEGFRSVPVEPPKAKPPILLPNPYEPKPAELPKDTATPDPPETRSNWRVNKPHGCQCLPWLLTNPPRPPDQEPLIQFQTEEHTFIESASNGSRVIVSGTPHDEPNKERLSFYDLPKLWQSTNYYTRFSDGSATGFSDDGLFKKLAARGTEKEKPLMFSLDDIVLTNFLLTSETDWDPTKRAALFSNEIKLFKPDIGNELSFLTEKWTQKDGKRNYIEATRCPSWTRLVVANGKVYDVFSQRTVKGKGDVVGARAGVRWLDPKNALFPPSSDDEQKKRQFFKITENYFQEHNYYGAIGNSDLCEVRCCDVDGDNEKAFMFQYFKFHFKHEHYTDAAKKWNNETVRNIEDTWNGETPVKLVSADAKVKTTYQVRWFMQATEDKICHTKITVKEGKERSTRMGNIEATWATNDLKERPNVAVHESGHASSLDDDYLEPALSCSYSRPGFRDSKPGAPYASDKDSMMGDYLKTIRARHFWQHAAYLFKNFKPAGTEFGISLAGLPLYQLPHNTADPLKNYYNWPIKQLPDQKNNSRGLFDLFLYPLGKDAYSQGVLRAGKAFDAILIVKVKMRFSFHTNDFDKIHGFLQSAEQAITKKFRDDLNFKASGNDFKHCWIEVSPRFLVDNFADNEKYKESTGINNAADYAKEVERINKDHPAHFTIQIKDKWPWDEEKRWEGGSAASRKLRFEHDDPEDFWEFFAEMLGLGKGERPSANNFLGIAAFLDGGKTIPL